MSRRMLKIQVYFYFTSFMFYTNHPTHTLRYLQYWMDLKALLKQLLWGNRSNMWKNEFTIIFLVQSLVLKTQKSWKQLALYNILLVLTLFYITKCWFTSILLWHHGHSILHSIFQKQQLLSLLFSSSKHFLWALEFSYVSRKLKSEGWPLTDKREGCLIIFES